MERFSQVKYPSQQVNLLKQRYYICIILNRDIIDVPIEINGTGISSGSFEFEGSALVFHKTSGEPFTVTYSVNAVAKDVTRQKQ